ncbi:dual specificity protein phosphatase 12, partial [Aureobasidium melanogenum]
MSLLDKVPGDLKLYIGGIFTLRRKDQLAEAGITHVLSVLRLPLEEKLFEGYKHMVIEVDDVEDENLLEHFPAATRFIEDGLASGGAVLVHCAMGKSRSATCVIAYLMQKYHISPAEALEQIRQSRPLCEPNEGFMKQLELYHEMQTPENVEDTPTYQRWVYQREVEMSRACGQAPEAEKIRFEDEHVAAKDESGFDMRCRKCRRTLATSQFLIPHQAQRGPADSCTHYFLDPLSWMRPELEKGEVEGRLECPNVKCKANVGKYAWQGMRCSCGEWIVPAISLSKGRIDEAKKRAVDPSAMGIRMPATANPRGPGQNNL